MDNKCPGKKRRKKGKKDFCEYPGECYFFKELFGAQSDRDSMVLSKVMQKHFFHA